MSQYKKLSHTIYYCVSHIVFCPKYRYRIMDKTIVDHCKQHMHHLCSQKELVEVMELNIQPDHIHIILWIPPKHSVSHIMGFLKGKLALKLFGNYEKLNRRYWG